MTDVKNKFNVPIFLGGVQTILQPEIIEEMSEVDGVCVGEGELVFLNLVNKVESGNSFLDVKNFWFRNRDGRIIKNELESLVRNLDLFPFPDRLIFKYFQKKRKKSQVRIRR